LAKTFLLIETVVGRTKEVTTALKQLQGVKSVDGVTGPYDIIAIIEPETLNDIGDLVTGKIHSIAGISRTVVCVASPFEKKGHSTLISPHQLRVNQAGRAREATED